ncbi:hypothetical protein JG688_00017664 [Phytophthora aleatoria]|uniref:DOT1 domain-containing protein n=1 Tax=Phytophthora aleatoria TaxID=2496075 RepID=A0A8J5IC49_9STRA|nr:hypothetical protein JG688_00017664 [Phytophthora aleatoria]
MSSTPSASSSALSKIFPAPRPTPSSTAPFTDATQAIFAIFRDVSAGDVRQEARQIHGNAGEVLPVGVSALIEALGPWSSSDVVLDIGADAKACIGLEVRSKLFSRGDCCIRKKTHVFPKLKKVSMLAGDVRVAALSPKAPFQEAAVVFANSFLFEEGSKLAIARELCAMAKVRIVAVSCLFCPRHRSSCARPFCSRWVFARKIDVPSSWKSKMHDIYVNTRK